jgi:FKBP-type peptidyl-prolyl cis-trans isomerase FklB
MHLQLYSSILFCLLTANVALADQATPADKAPVAEQATLSDKSDRINYTIGHQIGTDFKRQKVKLNEQALRQGLQHGQSGTAPLLKQKEMQALLRELKRNITDKMKKEAVERINSRKQIENRKRSESEAFMRKNQTREGVKTMPSGLQYKVLKKGNGIKPKVNDYVTINYRARKLNGKEYDSSFKKGGPVTYPANGIIPGFTQAIQMMQPGAKWELYIPPDLAYGRKSPLAHQAVIIEVELLAVSKQK